MFLAGFALTLFSYIKNPQKFLNLLNRKLLGSFCLLGFVAIYISNIFEIWGIDKMSSGKACFIFSTAPFISAALSYYLLKETLSRKKIIGMSIGMLGLIPLQMNTVGDEGDLGSLFVGIISLVIATTSACYGWILLQKVLKEHDISPLDVNGPSMLLGGIFALVHSYFFEGGWSYFPVYDLNTFLINTLAMIIISNFICYNLYGYLLKKYSATFMSLAGLITPIFAALYGGLFLEEQLSWNYFISFILFVLGLVTFHTEELVEKNTSIQATS